jgi:5-oxoprolinase (ATP-hydrolysing)
MLRISVDTGGTFTDVVCQHADGTLHLYKLLSTPDDPSRAIRDGVERLAQGQPLQLIHGTTVATNALLERALARAALITTQGFEDLLALRRQHRPHLYLPPALPAPIIPRTHTLGAPERILASGHIALPLTQDAIAQIVNQLRTLDVEAVAICLLHAYLNPAHEQALADAIRAALPHLHVTASHALIPELREFERASTTAINAAVGPVMARYLANLQRALAPNPVEIFSSAGARLRPDEAARHPAHTVLSGPAGGLLGAVSAARDLHIDHIITLDMGGTSTDVSLCAGALSMRDAGEVEGMPVCVPMLDLHTVGAGGGSIAWIDQGGALRVGPRSAGALPGPACYGRGGRLPTVTDAHLVLGHLLPDRFLGGAMRLDVQAARDALATIASPLGMSIEEAARGVLDVADAAMARAIKVISLERGHDPRRHTLVAFGGAGGLHACRLAQQLDLPQILLPEHPGLLSARGMLTAPRAYMASQTTFQRLDQLDPARLTDLLRALELRAREAMQAPDDPLVLEPAVELRYLGQTFTLRLPVPWRADDPSSIIAPHAQFEAAHQDAYGWTSPGRPVELVTLRLLATLASDIDTARKPLSPPAARLIAHDGVVERSALAEGDVVHGPCVIVEYSATTPLLAGWAATRQANHLVITRITGQDQARAPEAAPDSPVQIELFRHLFASIAEEMGVALMRSAFSSNIKERRDYSCAIFDAQGEMIAQAAHIPVHLGSTPMSVAAAIAAYPAPSPGDHILLNDPFHGGTHLPDLTLVSPVHGPDGAIWFWVANRAHHADVGGIAPGSLPLSRSIHDEGFCIGPTLLTPQVEDALAAASRTPDERRGDLRAQIAANTRGARRLVEQIAQRGATLIAACDALKGYSERILRAEIARLPDGQWCFEDVIEDDGQGAQDIKLSCVLTIAGDSATLDLTGSADQVTGPLNVPRAVTLSAALYCFACLTPEAPANAGLMRPITVRTRPGSIADALYPAAVAAGNVETSQRLVDVIFGALAQAAPDRIPAASCGSMNNVLIGGLDPKTGQQFAYYETIGGGSGAGDGWAGQSATQTHMTNTLNTPVEALEHTYPLRVTRYAVRRGSGGAGRWRGGDGIVRAYMFEAPATVTLMTERRRVRPWGLQGGEAGAAGVNTRIGLQGVASVLPAKLTLEVAAGEEIVIETPGGGGFGAQQP